MRADIVFGREALEASACDWWRLFRTAHAPTPFQSPAWLLPWCRHLGRGEVLAVLIRDGSAPIGLAAFTVAPEGGVRVLRPLGSGVTDICDVLTDAEGEREIASAIVQALLEHAGWERCVWDGLPTGSPLIAAAALLVQATRSEEIAPVLRIGGDAGRLQDAVPRAMAENIRACRKRADKMGGLSIRAPAVEECDAFLDSLFALHAARWRLGGEPGVLSHPAVQAFHRAALPALLQAGLARVHIVAIGGRLAAAHYGLAAGGTHFYYIGGFDPELGAAGPGHLAVAQAIERALQEGAAAFHFLRGDEAYKRRWGAEPDRLVTLSFSR